MREIVFRGKCIDNGEWVEGNYGYFKAVNGEEKFHHITTENGKAFRVIPETVGQYTGLTDKNGTKIFEGDILKGVQYPYFSDGEYNYFAEVVWFDNCPAFGIYTFKNPKAKVKGISTGNKDYMEDWDPDDWEVIGNINDNPELLEVEE